MLQGDIAFSKTQFSMVFVVFRVLSLFRFLTHCSNTNARRKEQRILSYRAPCLIFRVVAEEWGNSAIRKICNFFQNRK